MNEKEEKYRRKVVAGIFLAIIAVLIYLYYQEYNNRMKLLDEFETTKAEYEERVMKLQEENELMRDILEDLDIAW